MKEKQFIPISRPVLGEDEIKEVSRVINSGWVTQGPEVEAFENDFSEYVGSKYALAVSSCTAALHLALKVVGAGEDDEVITVSHSYIATANSVRYCGAIPVFIDIEPETYNIDPNLIEQAITDRTKAILCVHQMGMPCDLEGILQISKRYNLPLIEDAACAIGSEISWKGNWEKIGKPHGDIACFSFHPRKLVTTGDGGMLTTNNHKYNENIRLLRQHAMTIPDTTRHQTNNVIFEEYSQLGYNYRMTDIQASIGRVQLKRLPDFVKKRRELVNNYNKLLKDYHSLTLPEEPKWAKSNWQSFCIRFHDKINQKNLMQYLLDQNISTRRGIMCAHLEPAYNNSYWCTEYNKQDRNKLRYSEMSTARTILLPLYHELNDNEQRHIVHKLIEYISRV